MMKRRKKMTEAMVTIKFKESEINIMYESLKMMADKVEDAKELRDALKKLKQRIQDEKEKAKDSIWKGVHYESE